MPTVLNGPARRETLLASIQPDGDTDQATSQLHNALHATRAALASRRHPGTEVITYEEDCYALGPGLQYTVDVVLFKEYQEKAENEKDRSKALVFYAEAEKLYRGEFMAGFDADWVLQERERYRTGYLTILEAIARIYQEQDKYPLAIRYAERILRVDRCWEPGHQVLMMVYARTNRRTAAIRQYQYNGKVSDGRFGGETRHSLSRSAGGDHPRILTMR
ncbi:MAG: hypothetical protein HY326_03920 [Chloroflexi bacterium]|nr:hypothetical protein [Chloroflexota bacterium]